MGGNDCGDGDGRRGGLTPLRGETVQKAEMVNGDTARSRIDRLRQYF